MLVKKPRAVIGWFKSMASTLNSKKIGELFSYFFSLLIRNIDPPTKLQLRFMIPKKESCGFI